MLIIKLYITLKIIANILLLVNKNKKCFWIISSRIEEKNIVLKTYKNVYFYLNFQQIIVKLLK